MNKYKLLFFACFVLLFVACEDQLNIEPAQSISGDFAVTSESNIENILIGVYDEAGQGPSYGGQIHVISELIGNDGQVNWGGTFLAPAEIINRSILPDNGFVGGLWNNAYEVINQANLVIENIAIVTSDAAKKDRLEGEARFLRALNYFDLANHFSAGGKGVPLRTSGILDYSQDLSIARASSTDIYNLVISDLEAAISLLSGNNSFFADKYSAQGLLARVQLYLGNYAEALAAANDVIEQSGHSLASDYSGAFNNDADGTEDLFSFQVTSQTGTNSMITFFASEGNGGRGGDISVSDAYTSLFEAGDARGSFFYTSPDNGNRLTSKYTNQFGNVPVLRLAEMYLIRAEANFELGSAVGNDPTQDVNVVRARAGASLLSNVQKANILNERQLELAFEGHFIHDVKRTQGMAGTFNYDDPKLVLPIPQAEMDTNPLMEQNPSY